MPAKYISNELCLLIRERAYSRGALSALERMSLSPLRTLCNCDKDPKSPEAKQALIASIGVLDTEITSQLPVDPEDIRPILRKPRSGSKHGAIVRTIVRVLVSSPTPVCTPDIILILVDELGWPYGTREEREIARRKVVQPLRLMAHKRELWSDYTTLLRTR